MDCLKGHTACVIGTGFHGFCPSIKCPLNHEQDERHLLPYSQWTKMMPEETVTRYNRFASSAIEILCGNCHRQGSVLVKRDTSKLDEFREKIREALSEGHTLEALMENLEQYSFGKLTSDDLYNNALAAFPVLNSGTDENAWTLMSMILFFVECPERRGALQLRHYRSRPKMRTLCCNQRQCWNCKTKTHEGKSCAENIGNLDHSVVPCPSCGVSLAKGDGCSSVTCFCGHSFDWKQQKNKVNGAKAFEEAYPSDTHFHCVRILTDSTEKSQIDLSGAYKAMNVVAINQKLMQWWTQRYPDCPAKCAATPDESVQRFPGRRDACKLFKERNVKSVPHCLAQAVALDSL